MMTELTRYIAVHGNKREDEEEATCTASCASVSLQCVKESRWQRRQERKGAVPVQEDGRHQIDYRVGKTGAPGLVKRAKEEKSSTVTHNVFVGKRQWCLGNGVFIVPTHMRQNNVKVTVNNTWTIPPFCHMPLEGAVVLDGTRGTHEKILPCNSRWPKCRILI